MDEKTRLVIKIMHLAYLVQQLTDYCVFIYFSGHVDKLEVSIRQSKTDYQTKVLEAEFCTVYKAWRDRNAPPLEAELKARAEVLERILTEHEIPFGDLDYEEEYSRLYTF